MMRRTWWLPAMVLCFAGCPSSNSGNDAGSSTNDAGVITPFDAGPGPGPDASFVDAGTDAGEPHDAGTSDAGHDAGTTDAGVDAGEPSDAGPDAGADAGSCGDLGEACCAGDAGPSCSSDLTCQDSVCAFLWSQWPAPSDQPPTSQYTDNGDGTVTDTSTSLIWQKTESGTYNWAAAQTYCRGLTLHGVTTGWRLPTMNELITLVDFANTSPAINTSAFPNTPTGPHWTATPSAVPESAYSIDFADGSGNAFAGISGAANVRCVLSPP